MSVGQRWRLLWRFKVSGVWCPWHSCGNYTHESDAVAKKEALQTRGDLWMPEPCEVKIIDLWDQAARRQRAIMDPVQLEMR